jgi:hypothetical protein
MAYTTIDKPTDYFNTILYTGNGSTKSITGVGFQPDFIWLKERSSTGNHKLNDVIRGTNKYLSSNLSDAEDTTGSGIQSYDSDGFSISNATDINDNTETYVAWNWYTGATASSNTDGSITSSVSANTTAGFSIVSYTGTGSNATVGHGLGSAPSMIIFKNRSDTEGWKSYHKSLGATKNLNFNENVAAQTQSGAFNDTEPTSSVFSVGTFNSTNGSSDNMIAYSFAEKKGYSKFGSYVASGDATDANFIYLGFKPSWVMFKKTSGADNWLILDNKRSSSSGKNLVDFHLRANLSNAESDLSGSDNGVDFLSNGIKLRKNNGEFNASGGTYIYMAFAENPFVTSTGICCTAR